MELNRPRKLTVRRETIRELNPDLGDRGPIAESSGTDVSNNCCNPTCPTLTARTDLC